MKNNSVVRNTNSVIAKRVIVKRVIVKSASAVLLALTCVSSGQAGPIADWWLNNTQPAYPVAAVSNGLTPVTSGYGTYPYNAYTGYPNTSYSPILPAGLPQTNYGLLPTGGYASQYYRAPTTYYRPVTALDPNTGTTVTSLQPCASYQYQAQRVPLLVPSWSNYAYGGYGASTLQNRWSPITAPSVGSSAGQSSLSIASGFGTYGTSPVVQIPTTGAVLNTRPALPAAQPITSGYGGIYYNQPNSNPIIGTGSVVVPAAAWATPTTSNYGSPVLNGTAYASPSGGYFGMAPQTFTQPATVMPALPTTTTNGYAPSGPTSSVNGVMITPIGPPTSSSYPTGPTTNTPTSTWSPSQSLPSQSLPSQTLPSQTMPSQTMPSQFNSSSQTYAPGASSTFGAMPGSMGLPVMPPAVSTTVEEASNSVMPPIMPSVPAPNSSWTPSPTNTNGIDYESKVAPSLNPSVAQNLNLKPEASQVEERPRFQLRSVERAPQANETPSEKPASPWSSQANENPNSTAPSKNLNNNSEELELKLNMDSLRPIPPPQNFDASPDWKPALLNARDQTASQDPRIRNIDDQRSEVGSFREVRFLNSVRSVELAPPQTILNDGNVKATLRPIQKSSIPADSKSTSVTDRDLNASGRSTVSGR